MKLLLFLPEDDVPQSLACEGGGFTDFAFAVFARVAVGFDAEGDGSLVDGDADFGITTSGREIAEEFFRLGLSESEAVEAMADD